MEKQKEIDTETDWSNMVSHAMNGSFNASGALWKANTGSAAWLLQDIAC